MRWPSIFGRREATAAHEAPARGIKGATIRVRADPGKFRLTSEIQHEKEQHAAYNEAYETTVAGSIIDTETDDLFAQGWALIGENPDDVAAVREYLTAVNFETETKKLATESKIYGFGIAEVGTVGNKHQLVAHSSFNIYPRPDDDGWLDRFIQIGNNDTLLTEWAPREVIALALRPNAATPGTGRSQLAQAYSSIVDYENIRKANTEMVLRMGYPTYDIEFTDTDGVVPQDALEGDISDLAPGSILSTGLGAKINTLNSQGVTQVQTYSETALQALSVAMQVPRSMVGLVDNSEATARVTQAKYYNRIAAEQAIIAQTMQARYLDIFVLPDLGIKKGTVQLVFNNPDPDAQLKKAQLLQIITALDPTDPEYLLSVEEQAELWGKHPKAGEYDRDKVLDTLKDAVMHHIAEIHSLEPQPPIQDNSNAPGLEPQPQAVNTPAGVSDHTEAVKEPLMVGQIQSMQNIIAGYKAGTYPREQAKQMLMIGVGLSDDEAEKVLGDPADQGRGVINTPEAPDTKNNGEVVQ